MKICEDDFLVSPESRGVVCLIVFVVAQAAHFSDGSGACNKK